MDSVDPLPSPTAGKRSRWRRVLAWLLGICLVLLIAVELVLRVSFGLGNPPLMMADPNIEYLFQPNQDVRRFGNRIHYNAWSMRSDDFPNAKSDPAELRILVIGDSVVNGGAQTDQDAVATSIIQRRLSEHLARPVVVGNISAGTWGPPNWLAYVSKYGLFDADLVVIVASSHDYADAPTFEPVVGVQPWMPDRKPMLALHEVVFRYILPRIRGSTADASAPSNVVKQSDVQQCLNALSELIGLAQAGGAEVIVAQYPAADELAGKNTEGHAMIEAVARQRGATVIKMQAAFRAAADASQDLYRDKIHPNAGGQRVIADVLFDAIMRQVPQPSTQQAGSMDSTARPG